MSFDIRLAALLLVLPTLAACPEASPATGEASSAKASVNPEPAPAPTEVPEPSEPATPPEPERKVSSGLDLGMTATPFESCEVGAEAPTCGPTDTRGPLVIAHGSLDDRAYVELLLDLQAVQRRYKAEQLKVLALTSDEAGTLNERREELSKLRRFELELRRVASDEKTWSEHYRVSQDRTVMFVDAESTVRYSEVAPAVLDTLDAAIVAAGVEVEIAEREAEKVD